MTALLEAKEKIIARRVVLLQILATILGAGVFCSSGGNSSVALAFLCGGGVSVANGALLAWRMCRTAANKVIDAHYQLRLMYFYAVERFLMVVVLLGLCMVSLRLPHLAVLVGFVAIQMLLPIGRWILGFETGITNKNV